MVNHPISQVIFRGRGKYVPISDTEEEGQHQPAVDLEVEELLEEFTRLSIGRRIPSPPQDFNMVRLTMAELLSQGANDAVKSPRLLKVVLEPLSTKQKAENLYS